MAARGFRSVGRVYTEVSADLPADNHLTYLGAEDDDGDELAERRIAQRRGRRPARPAIPVIAVADRSTNDETP